MCWHYELQRSYQNKEAGEQQIVVRINLLLCIHGINMLKTFHWSVKEKHAFMWAFVLLLCRLLISTSGYQALTATCIHVITYRWIPLLLAFFFRQPFHTNMKDLTNEWWSSIKHIYFSSFYENTILKQTKCMIYFQLVSKTLKTFVEAFFKLRPLV